MRSCQDMACVIDDLNNKACRLTCNDARRYSLTTEALSDCLSPAKKNCKNSPELVEGAAGGFELGVAVR